MTRQLTGFHVLAMFVGGFAVIITVNLILAYNAIHSFPGLETRNGYVASQSFDARRQAQQDLHWQITNVDHGNGTLGVTMLRTSAGAKLPQQIDLSIGRVTNQSDDKHLVVAGVNGHFSAVATLAPGLWQVWIEAQSDDGTLFRQRHEFTVNAND